MATTETGVKITATERVSAAASKAAGALRGLGGSGGVAGRAFGALSAAASGVFGALSQIGRVAVSAAKTIGTVLVGAVMAAVGAFALIKRGLQAMRESVERVQEGTGGVAATIDDAAEASDRLGSSITETANAVSEAASKVDVTLGAFGEVGEGFIQRAGAVTERVKEQAESAAGAAKEANDALAKTDEALGGSATRLSRFGAALDRISAAWQKTIDRIFAAIAVAITPALEDLADLMESEEFQEFVDLLAEDLAEAAEDVAEWFSENVIPAIRDFMKAVKEAGGPFAYFSDQWRIFKERVNSAIQQTLMPAVGLIEIARQKLADIGVDLEDIFAGIATSLGLAINGPLEALRDLADEVFGIIRDGIDALPDWFLNLIGMGGGGGGGGDGGGGNQPQTGPRQPGIASMGGAGMTLNIYVQSTGDAYATGQAVGAGALNEMRRRGIRLPTLA